MRSTFNSPHHGVYCTGASKNKESLLLLDKALCNRNRYPRTKGGLMVQRSEQHWTVAHFTSRSSIPVTTRTRVATRRNGSSSSVGFGSNGLVSNTTLTIAANPTPGEVFRNSGIPPIQRHLIWHTYYNLRLSSCSLTRQVIIFSV